MLQLIYIIFQENSIGNLRVSKRCFHEKVNMSKNEVDEVGVEKWK